MAGAASGSTAAGFAGAFFATFFAGAAAAGAPSDGAGKAARSLRATGASIEEDGPLTNSPSSASLLMISLFSTPSSFASS